MSTIPAFPEPLPNKTQSVETFNNAMYSAFAHMNPWTLGANAVRDEIMNAYANVQASVAGLAELAWVSGATYVIGDVRYSLLDFNSYRRKTNGAGTTDPANDPVNWVIQTKTSLGGADIHTSGADITLTSLSPRFNVVTMTTAGMRVILPSAATMQKGVGVLVFKNTGMYRFAVVRSDETFLCFVEPGQNVSLNLSDTSTAAGKWHVIGQNLQNIFDMNAPVQLHNAATATFAAASLTTTKAIFAYKGADSFLYVKIFNAGSAPGAAVKVGTDAANQISIAANGANQYVVCYKLNDGSTKAYLIDNPSGDTLTVGNNLVVDTGTGMASKCTAMLSIQANKLLCLFTSSGGIGNCRVLDIVSNDFVPGAITLITGANDVFFEHIVSEKLSTSKLLVGAGKLNVPVHLQLMSLSGSTPAASGTVLTLPNNVKTKQIGMCVLNTNRALVSYSADPAVGDIVLALIDVSGLTPVLLRTKPIKAWPVGASVVTTLSKVDDNTAHLSWTGGHSKGVDAMTVRVSADDQMIFGVIAEKLDANALVADGAIQTVSLNSTSVLQLCHTTTPGVNGKIINIADITDSSQIATSSASSVVVGGEGGTGDPGQSSYFYMFFAQDSLGTGFTNIDNGTMPYAAWRNTTEPIVNPSAGDFAGLWFPRFGIPGTSILAGNRDPLDTDGFTGWMWFNTETKDLFGPKSTAATGAWGAGISLKGDAGAQGDKAGLGYMLGASLEMDDPGFGWCRFSIDTFNVDDTGFFAVSQKTIAGQLVLAMQRIWAVNDLLTFQGNSNESTELTQIEITSREEMDAGLWQKIGFKVISGTGLTSFTQFSLLHQKIFGLDQVLNNNVARFDALGNLIDKNNVKQSGIENGTQAALLAKNMTDFNRQYYLVNSGVNGGVRGAGVRFRGNGTEAVADGPQTLFNQIVKFKAIFPDTQATAISNNAGKTKLAANTHLLTAGEAVDAVEPVSVYISAWTGTGVAGWYNILSVDDVNNYTIDLTYAAGLGTPTVALKGTQVVAPFSVQLGKLGNHSQITVKLRCQYTASATAKTIYTRLNATEFSSLNQNDVNKVISSYEYGFFNDGAKNKQEVLFDKFNGTTTGSSASANQTTSEDTSADSTLFFRVNSATANQVIGIRRLTVIREH